MNLIVYPEPTNIENWQIRRARCGEEQSICSLLYQSFIDYKSLYTKKAFEATTLPVDKIRERIDEKIIWVGLLNNVISATVSLQPRHQGMYIKSLAVLPAARKKGLGRELVRHAVREAVNSNLALLELTTTPFLVEAISLYKTCGFEACGYEDLYGTQLIKMKKILNPTVNLANDEMTVLND